MNDDLAARRRYVDHSTLLASCAELAYLFEVHDPQLPIECWEAVWRIQNLLYPERTPACCQDGQHHPA